VYTLTTNYKIWYTRGQGICTTTYNPYLTSTKQIIGFGMSSNLSC